MPDWGEKIEASASLPQVEDIHLDIGQFDDYTIPDLTGLGLSDALYLLENRGFKVSYSGEGLVASQTPPAGEQGSPGQLIKLELD